MIKLLLEMETSEKISAISTHLINPTIYIKRSQACIVVSAPGKHAPEHNMALKAGGAYFGESQRANRNRDFTSK